MSRDGVIDAKIDHANGWLVSTEAADVYSTEEPQTAFHKYEIVIIACVCLHVQLILTSVLIDHTIKLDRRIAFCLDVYNEALRSMRYPPDAYKRELANQGMSASLSFKKLGKNYV